MTDTNLPTEPMRPIWVSTTRTARWTPHGDAVVTPLASNPLEISFTLHLDSPAQEIEGFGTTFNERGGAALAALPDAVRQEALAAVFGDDGARLSHCRTPIAATDLSFGWYSYDETDGDFALADFSIERDREHLIPFIRSAQAHRPDLTLWSSPWSPPVWMKTITHYALAPAWPGTPDNGMTPERRGYEGNTYFVEDDRYLDAYARYFRRYVEAYAEEGIAISAVMPQNEFNSAQPFPSCCWTPEALARFIPHLAREMDAIGVEVLLGTLERPDATLIDRVLADPAAAAHIKGIGVQWAGKAALAALRLRHPGLKLWGTEHECGRGDNDWRYARYGWDCVRQYLAAGASVWTYWNTALGYPNVSGWGWPQNALVMVDETAGTFELTSDYWLMRHLSAFVEPGARFIPTGSFMGYENQLAFRNPNGDIVIVVHNAMADPQPILVAFSGQQMSATLPGESFNTFRIPTTVAGG